MRWVFFVLLAANLALAAYAYMRDHAPSPDAQLLRQQLNAEQIRIVAPRPPPASAPVVAAPAASVCVEWGSFGAADLPKAQAAVDALALGERLRRIEVSIATSYWVYIPPLRSKAEMERKTGELKERGVDDYSPILEAGRWRYAIALGVFRNEDGARKHLAALRAKGVRSAQIGEREQKVTQAAFLLRDPTDEQALRLGNLKSGFPGSEVRAVECPPS
ncbi:MAG TPA: SPOR domain-containing protein [Burkholderiales bacterium]